MEIESTCLAYETSELPVLYPALILWRNGKEATKSPHKEERGLCYEVDQVTRFCQSLPIGPRSFYISVVSGVEILTTQPYNDVMGSKCDFELDKIKTYQIVNVKHKIKKICLT